MARGLNKVMLIGNLGVDPEVKDTKGGTVAKIRLATTEAVKKKGSDEWEEITTWHNVTLFNKNAKFCKEYLKKGACVYVEAKLRNDKWKDDKGNDRYGLDIIGYAIQRVGNYKKEDQVADEEQQADPLSDVE